ncbi:MAG: hypothetical protein ACR5LF_06610 [Symbiopectobacterium sp.]
MAKVTGAVPLIIVATIGNTLGGMYRQYAGRHDQSSVGVHSATAKTTYRHVNRATLVTALWSGGDFV